MRHALLVGNKRDEPQANLFIAFVVHFLVIVKILNFYGIICSRLHRRPRILFQLAFSAKHTPLNSNSRTNESVKIFFMTTLRKFIRCFILQYFPGNCSNKFQNIFLRLHLHKSAQ